MQITSKKLTRIVFIDNFNLSAWIFSIEKVEFYLGAGQGVSYIKIQVHFLSALGSLVSFL